MVEKKDYTDDELTAWLNGEFKVASSRELERSITLDNDLRDRVSSLAADISAVEAEMRNDVPETVSQAASHTLAAKIAIAAIAVSLIWLLFS